MRIDRPPLPLDRRTVLGGLTALPFLSGAPAGASPAACSFLVVGDWGKNGSQVQRQVAAAMGRAAAQVGSRVVVSAGDNFYPQGGASPADPHWRTSSEEVYTAAALQTPWYAALGNHDYRGAPQAQIEYSKRSNRWRMPSRYYKVSGASLGAPALE